MNSAHSCALFKSLVLLLVGILSATTRQQVSCQHSSEAAFSYLNLNEDKTEFVNGVEYKYLLSKKPGEPTMHLTKSKRSSYDSSDEVFKRQSDQPSLCTYTHIKSQVDECFTGASARTLTSNNCIDVLECISALNLVKTCSEHGLYTPTVWILNVYDILLSRNFCSMPVECDSNDNEYLIKLNNVMKSVYEYGQAFLNQPFVDNKFYCSKSHNLVFNVRDLFYPLDQCFNSTVMNDIMFDIEESAGPILQPNCRKFERVCSLL